MDGDLDSRTAAFSPKKPGTEGSFPEGGGGSPAFTAYQRNRRVKKLNKQNFKDFVPSGGSFSANAALLDAEYAGTEHAVEDQQSSHLEQYNTDPAMFPSKSWNTGAKAKIRVSLRERPADSPNAKPPDLTPQDASKLISNVALVPMEGSTEEDHKARTDVALAEERRLYLGNMAYATTETDLRQLFSNFSIEECKVPVNPRTSRSVGYAFVTLRTHDEALRAVEQLNHIVVADRKLSIQLARPGTMKADPDTRSRRQRNKARQTSSLDTGKKPSSRLGSNQLAVALDSGKSGANPILSTSGAVDSEIDQRGQAASYDVSLTSSPEGDDGVLINVHEESGSESGEISDSVNAPMDSQQAPSRAVQLDGAYSDDSEEENEESKDNDAMMDYANAKAQGGDSGHRRAPLADQSQPPGPYNLAKLDRKDLELQLRYFHVGRVPFDVDLNEPVRCLVCTGQGHVAAECEKLKCNRCSQENAHSTWNCPLISQTERPYASAVCGMCDRQGHITADCELRWRTSGRPWQSNVEDKSIRFNCYECGKSGHLGNDCPSRRPGKPKGSSSWSYHRHPRRTEAALQGISIKGRAQQQQRKQEPIVIDDSDDDQTNFYRPRIAKAARPGQICILPGNGPNPGKLQSQNQLTFSNNQQHGERFGGRQRSASPRRMDFSPPEERSPIEFERANAGSAYRYAPTYQQPPLPRGPPPYRRRSPPVPVEAPRYNPAPAYRPMPSSAKQAWTQFRR
ncbi:MAG: hypothetical protein LQ346_005555 [Caloplaca aetnensis]|nr:MAG: hypothetical protein LQ346_005555 [Caloplaca aetnensis]